VREDVCSAQHLNFAPNSVEGEHVSRRSSAFAVLFCAFALLLGGTWAATSSLVTGATADADDIVLVDVGAPAPAVRKARRRLRPLRVLSRYTTPRRPSAIVPLRPQLRDLLRVTPLRGPPALVTA